MFDTGAVIDIYHGRERVRPYFERIIEPAGAFAAFVSPITEAELWLRLRPGEIERHEALLIHFISLPLTSEVGRLAGEWMRPFGSAGLGWMDALIAAMAAMAGVPLLTHDRRLAKALSNEVDTILYDL